GRCQGGYVRGLVIPRGGRWHDPRLIEVLEFLIDVPVQLLQLVSDLVRDRRDLGLLRDRGRLLHVGDRLVLSRHAGGAVRQFFRLALLSVELDTTRSCESGLGGGGRRRRSRGRRRGGRGGFEPCQALGVARPL